MYQSLLHKKESWISGTMITVKIDHNRFQYSYRHPPRKSCFLGGFLYYLDMQKNSKKFFLLFLCFLLFFEINTFAYSADVITQKQADQFVRQINKKLASFSDDKAEKLKILVHDKLVQIQNTLIGKTDAASLQKNALYELVRYKLFSDSFETKEAFFDDGVGAIWTHAPKGFGILYNPTETPTI